MIVHTTQDLQTLMDQSSAFKDFSLTISLNKTKLSRQGTDITVVKNDNNCIKDVKSCVYLDMSNVLIDTEINCCIEKASSNFVPLLVIIWDNPMITIRIKLIIQQVCVCSTLLYFNNVNPVKRAREENQHLPPPMSMLCSQNKAAIEDYKSRSADDYQTHHHMHNPQLVQPLLT